MLKYGIATILKTKARGGSPSVLRCKSVAEEQKRNGENAPKGHEKERKTIMSKCKLCGDGKYSETYKVTGITTETDREIIDYCAPCSFGGSVLRCGDVATVTVYID